MSKTVDFVDEEGACALSEALKVNTILETLNLGCVRQQNNSKQGHMCNN